MCDLSDFEQGKVLLLENKRLEALAFFQKAYEADRESPERQSYYALTNALERGQIAFSLELAMNAIEKMPDTAELYLNLGRIYLKADRKAEAAGAFHKGISIDPDNKEIKKFLSKLGNRRKPILRSLPRTHFLNKYLGLISYFLLVRIRAKYDELVKKLSQKFSY